MASGVPDRRPKLLALLDAQASTLIVVEHKDRLTRLGFRYVDTLLRGQSRALEVVNEAGNETEDLLADLTAMLSRFLAFSLYRAAVWATSGEAHNGNGS